MVSFQIDSPQNSRETPPIGVSMLGNRWLINDLVGRSAHEDWKHRFAVTSGLSRAEMFRQLDQPDQRS